MLENVFAAAHELITLQTMALMMVGTIAGLLAGGIPGFTITMAVVLTLPFTFGMEPIQGLATMIGVFVGGLSGGLMSGILPAFPAPRRRWLPRLMVSRWRVTDVLDWHLESVSGHLFLAASSVQSYWLLSPRNWLELVSNLVHGTILRWYCLH